MAISGVFMFVAKYVGSWEMLIIGRLLIGVNSGLNAGLAPMYLTEISPTALRGAVSLSFALEGIVPFKPRRRLTSGLENGLVLSSRRLSLLSKQGGVEFCGTACHCWDIQPLRMSSIY